MSAVCLIGIFAIAMAAGCVEPVKDVPPRVTAQTEPLKVDSSALGAKQDSAVAPVPRRAEVKVAATGVLSAPPVAARPSVISENKATAIEPAATVTSPSPSQSTARPAPAPGKVAAAPVVIDEQPRKNEIALPVAKKSEPPLDMATLKMRLRDTNGIGVFTKLALKNQVDDLLQQFRACYQRVPKASVASLRQPYDMLVLKVLAVIQDNDPSLARAISGSREAIWGMLADPEKFNTII